MGRDSLVAEVAVDLVDLRDPAHDETLQVELRGDAQVQREIERVVVRHERPRDRSAGDRLHHRRLDLEEAALVEEAADRADDRGPALEDLAGFGVDRQIQVALTVPELDVLQAMPLLGKRTEALREERQSPRLHRQLAGPRPEHLALDAQPVPEIERAVEVERRFPHRVAAHVDLDPAAPVREIQKPRLAGRAQGENAAGGGDGRLSRLQLFARSRFELRPDLGDGQRRCRTAAARPGSRAPRRA